jgi:uncharacterized protein YmfQ (DUF2313 family)
MPAPIATAQDYLWQFLRLMPRGRIWQRGWGNVEAQDLLTLMPTWARLHARANQLLVDTFPCSTVELLPEWEASLGLPDPCTGPLETLQQRTASVCAKFAARGGQSVAYFKALAAAHGYSIEITQYAAFRVDINAVEDPLNDEAWDYAWTVTAPTTSITYFSADLSMVEEPLEWWGNEMLECLIRAAAPAHTVVMFQYLDAFSAWDAGASVWDAGNSVWDLWGAH